jgi:hypothetical protein
MAFPPSGQQYYRIASGFTGNDGQQPSEPFLIPPEYGPQGISTPGTLTVQVPGSAGPKFDTNNPPALPANADFSLSWPSAGLAQITAGSTSNVWNAGSTARQTLKSNFDALYQGLQGLEDQGQLALGAAYLIAQRVAEAMPLGLSEILLYRFNFMPKSTSNPGGYVDLVPGMRLRVEAASGLFSSPGSAFNGYAGSGASYWEIRRNRADQSLLFDAFTGVISSYAQSMTSGGAWGLVDLQSAGNMRYYRLFYPTAQFAAWPGYASCTEMCTLVGTQYLEDIALATSDYTGGSTVRSSGKGPIACTFFRGRTLIIPEMPIRVNADRVWVPVGTTARQLVESYTLPTFTSTNWQSQPVICYRVWSPADVGTGLTLQVQYMQDGSFPGSVDAWDMPLLKGDSVQFNFAV